MRILVLGGIAESRILAEALTARRFTVVYSIAGLVRRPRLACEVRVGGFSDGRHDGIEGMVRFIHKRGIDRILDATHPYAARISSNAVQAAGRAGISCWRYQRPEWKEEIRNSQLFDDWDDLIPMLRGSRRPFFTLGSSALDGIPRRLPDQHWILRAAVSAAPVENTTIVQGIGPFEYDHERAFMADQGVDALITKNSGSSAGVAKLHAARDLDIPVYVQRRPALAAAEQCFDHIDDLLNALGRPEYKSCNARATETGSSRR